MLVGDTEISYCERDWEVGVIFKENACSEMKKKNEDVSGNAGRCSL